MSIRITRQNVLKLMMLTFVLSSMPHAAQQVALSGTVTDTKGKALEGVTVKLAKTKDLSVVTNATGTFALGNATRLLLPKDLSTSYGIAFKNNALIFTGSQDKVTGKLSLFSIDGKLIASVTLDNLTVGQQALVLPNVSSGSYLLAGILNGRSFTRSLLCSGKENVKSNAVIKQGANDGSTSFGLRKTAAAVVVDTLIFSKEGYTSQNWPVNNLSKDKIRMALRATGGKPVVFMTKKLDKEGFLAMYKAIGYDLPGEVMVKVHTGEPNGKYFISSSRMSALVNQVNGTIVETCLGFSLSGLSSVGGRDTPAKALQISKDHGFDTIGLGLDIINTDGEIELAPVAGGSQLKGPFQVGKNFKNYQSSLVISHYKGHGIAGFGGALKNVALGFGGNKGKALVHNMGEIKSSISFSNNGEGFQKAMAEACKSIHDALGGNLVYINTLDNLVKACDCDANMNGGQGNLLMDDIGMLGSLDPVALDQACTDLVKQKATASRGKELVDQISKLKGEFGLTYGKTIGLGNTEYELVDIDK